jgi:hypothetical protein
MTDIDLLTPLLDPQSGIRNPNFFNGRLLTAEDLRTFQTANRDQHYLLGRAVGDGVVQGMMASLTSAGSAIAAPVVAVTAGLAVNRRGRVMALPEDLRVTLAQASTAAVPLTGPFADCNATSGDVTLTGRVSGPSVLVIRPVSAFQGRAPMRTLDPCGNISGCGDKESVEGVRFRLVPATMPAGFLNDPNRLNNNLAHLCFGTGELADFPTDPFKAPIPAGYGLIDALRTAGALTDCDVPLALVYWDQQAGVRFVDAWAVRRRSVQLTPDAPWPMHAGLAGGRRLAEAEAMFFQFQDHAEFLRAAEPNPGAVTAASRFRWLPAGGFVRLGAGAFNDKTFFTGLTTEDITLDDAFLRTLVRRSWFIEPIDLQDPPPLIELYRPAGAAAGRWLFFLRTDRTPVAPPPPEVGKGRVDVNVVVDVRKAIDALSRLGAPWVRSVFVTLIGDQSIIPVRFTGPKSLKEIEDLFKKGIKKGKIVLPFSASNVPAGEYLVNVYAPLFFAPEKSVTAVADQTVDVTIELMLADRPGKTGGKPADPGKTEVKPPLSGDGGIYMKGWTLEKYMMKHIPDRFTIVDPLWDPVPWERASRYAEWLRQEYPGIEVDPDEMRTARDPAHTPDSLPVETYAFVELSRNGIAVPLVLVPAGRDLDHRVPVEKEGVAGLDGSMARRFEAAGIPTLDVAAAAPTGIVADVMGVSIKTAAAAIVEFRGKVEDLQGSLRMFTGVDAGVEQKLKVGAKMTGPSDLANRDGTALAKDAGIPLVFAMRLVDEAREAVPKSEWSLESPSSGLRATDVTALHEMGIETQGMLKEAVADAARVDAVAKAMNTTKEVVSNVAGAISVRTGAQMRTEKLSAAPVESVPGVSTAFAATLRQGGILRVSDVLKAGEAGLKQHGVDDETARNVFNNAKMKAGMVP